MSISSHLRLGPVLLAVHLCTCFLILMDARFNCFCQVFLAQPRFGLLSSSGCPHDFIAAFDSCGAGGCPTFGAGLALHGANSGPVGACPSMPIVYIVDGLPFDTSS